MNKLRIALLLLFVFALSFSSLGARANPDQCSSCMTEGIEVGWAWYDQCIVGGGAQADCQAQAREQQCNYWDCFCPQCGLVQMLCGRQ